jgi:cytochrome c-type biogenesis protein CcmH/NrfG
MYKIIITICLFSLSLVRVEAKQFTICKEQFLINETQKYKKERSLESILKAQPENIECMLKLASVYLRTDKVSLAFDLITKAYELDPVFVRKAKISKILDLALRLSELKKIAKKKRDFNIYNDLAQAYFDMGIFNEAAKAFENSLNIKSDQPNKKILLAISYAQFYEYKSSQKIFKDILSQDSYNFYANYYYSKLLKNSLNDKRWKSYMMLAEYILVHQDLEFQNLDEKSLIRDDIRDELTK